MIVNLENILDLVKKDITRKKAFREDHLCDAHTPMRRRGGGFAKRVARPMQFKSAAATSAGRIRIRITLQTKCRLASNNSKGRCLHCERNE